MSVAAALQGARGGSVSCRVCGTTDHLGLGTCTSCASSPAEALVFLERSGRKADRRAIEAWLVEALGGVIGREEARDVADGVRPIVGLPVVVAGRASGSLSLRGLTATSVPAARAWRKMPAGMVGLLGAIVGAGLFAGLTVTPWLLALSVVFAGLTALAALRRLREPVWIPEPSNVLGLPEVAEQGVRSTLNRLTTERAYTYLSDLATLSAGLQNPGDGEPAPGISDAIDELLALASDAAVDLENLDVSLSVLERQGDDGPIEVNLAEAVADAAAARALLARKFDEALASLARLQTASVDAPARLTELAERIAEDANRRAEAFEAVQRLTA